MNLPLLLILLAMSLPLQGQDQLKFVRFGTNGNVIAEVVHAGTPEKKDEGSM
jgi:hypothetical protein